MTAPSPYPPPAPNEYLKLENQLCFPFYAISRQLTKAYQPYLQALGLTYPQYLVPLLLLGARGADGEGLGREAAARLGHAHALAQAHGAAAVAQPPPRPAR
ncbi:MAG: hypothetical protein WKG07_34115 [Hymenobacter sp.]